MLARTIRRLREHFGPQLFPRHLSVVAIGDEALPDVHEPALVMVTRPIRDIADSVADHILRRLDIPGSPVEEASIPPTFRPDPSIAALRR